MSTNKSKPQAGNLGRGRYGELSGALLDDSKSMTTHPTVFIVPQTGANCQVITISEKRQLLAEIDDVLEKFNRAWAAWLVSGDAGDFLAAQALAADRRALLQEIGGER